MEYKKKLEKLITKYVEVIFTTTKVSNYFSNKDNKPNELKCGQQIQIFYG